MGLTDIASGLFGDDEDDAGEDTEGDDFVGEGLADDDPLADDFGGDDLDDLDGWEDDDDLDGGGGSAAAELEPRIDELEQEVESISSSMGTVRSENEAISESVEDIEDNIRKLLDIYEMVTRGVNPFADDVQGGAGGMEGSFGLFDDATDETDTTDDLDPEVADADPEEFFDDDFDAVEDEEMDDDLPTGDADEEEEEEEGGKTFDDLKSEYESGEADWEGEPALADDADEDREAAIEVASGDAADDDLGGPETDDANGVASADGGPVERDDGKPYLKTLPSGYGSELLVIEWLSYLNEASDTSEALRAIRYYETVGWIGDEAADSLERYLSGIGGGELQPLPGSETQLTIDHHTASLHYIGRLGGADIEVERLEWGGGQPPNEPVERRGQRGIQR